MQKKNYPGTTCVFVHVYVYIKKEKPYWVIEYKWDWQEVFFPKTLHIPQSCHENVFPPTSDFLLLLFNQNKVKGDEKIEEEMVSYFQR